MMVAAVLAMSQVQSPELFGGADHGAIELNLQRGDLALIDARDAVLAGHFADLCCGLAAVESGAVKFADRDWTRLSLDHADAMRGRIGRVFSSGSWLGFLDATTNILLPQMHHTRRELKSLRDDAAILATVFGLPGLPAGPISALSPGDLLRAGFVRAFLGEPLLVILESPVQGLHADLVPLLLNRIAAMRDRGGAVLWLTRSRLVWGDRSFPATHRLRLSNRGLSPER
jgi:phospholipid/cholesterol/gamma-HCH transport system ATP-binding protein